MPRGRPKKSAVEPELLPLEENDQPSQQIRQVKHKTEWIESVPVEEAPDEDTETELEEVEIQSGRRKRTKNAIQEMRKKLRAQGVTPTSNLRLYIERYIHSETDAGGSWAETEFCTKYSTTEEHIFNKDYIDAARKWGPGKYRITIRMDNRIVDAFDERITAIPTGPTIQHINPNDPTSPQVIIQSTNGDGQTQQIPMSIKDIMKTQREALKEQLEMAKLMREAYGFAPEQQQQPRSEEEILSSAILKQPEVIENVVGSVIKRFGGASAKDDEPWYADVVRDAVKSGQLVQVVQVAIDRIFNGFGNLFPGRQNNGQAQMGTQGQPASNAPGIPMENVQGQNHQATPDQGDSAPLGLPQRSESTTNQRGADNGTRSDHNEQSAIPENQALSLLIDHCQRGIPAKIAFDRLIGYADLLNEQAPWASIDPYLEAFASMPVDAALEFVKTQPNGEQVVGLSHARSWTEELQRLIKEAGQEGEEE